MSEIEHAIADQPRAWSLAAKVGQDSGAVLPGHGTTARPDERLDPDHPRFLSRSVILPGADSPR